MNWAFFSPGNSSNYYIGIWYKSTSVQTIIWVANRDNPIPYPSHYSSSLVLTDGNLVLYNNLNVIFWTTSSLHEASNATEAILLETGNFVLRNGLDIVWQSFDHLTDTLLPGGRVGFDKSSNTLTQL